MKLVLMGAVAAIAATFATAALAQSVTEEAGRRAEVRSDANAPTPRSGNPLGEDIRNQQSRDTTMPHDADEPDQYRYHGGPKSND
jgi:hypothetical protein